MRASSAVIAALLTAHVRRSPIAVAAASTACFSGTSSNKGKVPIPDEATASVEFVSRSTANPEAAAQFSAGSDDRRSRLDAALGDIGIDASQITALPEFRGSAALRMYTSFLLPKSEGALATAEAPQRAAVIANSISFMMREHRSHQEEWLRNHDRSLEEKEALSGPTHPLIIILDNIRSAHNVGNILRAAEAARLDKVYLCGITPGPPNTKVLKTALGAAEYVENEQSGSTLEVVRLLKKQGVSVWGVETTSKSRPLWEVEMPKPVALVFGNEIVGVDTSVLKECDGIMSVPTYGLKNSLNVATCASVLIWEALRQWEVGPESEPKTG